MKKRVSLTITALLLSLVTSAQELRCGLSIGGLVCNPNDAGVRIGYRFGPTLQYYFSGKERTGFLETGIILTGKGWSGSESLMNKESKVFAHYLEFPIHIGYAVPLGHKVRFIGSIGPYFAAGQWGKADINYLYSRVPIFKDKIYQRFDCGWGFAVGIELPGQQRLSAAFEMSVVNPIKGPSSFNPSDRNFSLTLSLPF